jgi:hypothetical protein
MWIVLVLHLMPDADEPAPPWAFGERGEPAGGVGSGEIGPSDDAGDLVGGVGRSQHLRCLRRDGDGLHQHAGVYAGRGQLRTQLVQREVAPQ